MDLMNEKIRKFKNRYKYDPKTRTIEVDGMRIPVIINTSDNPKSNDYQPMPTGANFKNGVLQLGKEIFNPKLNTDEQYAILQHEIGHFKMVNYYKDNKMTDKNIKVIDDDTIDEYIAGMVPTEMRVKFKSNDLLKGK